MFWVISFNSGRFKLRSLSPAGDSSSSCLPPHVGGTEADVILDDFNVSSASLKLCSFKCLKWVTVLVQTLEIYGIWGSWFEAQLYIIFRNTRKRSPGDNVLSDNNNWLDLSTLVCSLTANPDYYWSCSMLKLMADLSDVLIGIFQWLWSLEGWWFMEAVPLEREELCCNNRSSQNAGSVVVTHSPKSHYLCLLPIAEAKCFQMFYTPGHACYFGSKRRFGWVSGFVFAKLLVWESFTSGYLLQVICEKFEYPRTIVKSAV